MKVPLLVHRWFVPGGAGWAYHPDLGPRLIVCQRELTGKLNGDPGPMGPMEVKEEGLTLIGVRKPDPDRATDRFDRRIPVVCAAALPGRTDEVGVAELQRLLLDFPPPGHAASDAALELEWAGTLTPFAPPRPAAPPSRRRGGGLIWVGGAVVGLLLVVGVCVLQGWNAGRGVPTAPVPTAVASQCDTAPEPPRVSVAEATAALIKEISTAETDTLQAILKRDFEVFAAAPEARGQVNRAFFGRAETLFERDAPRDFRGWKHAGDVDELVTRVDALAGTLPPAEHPLRRAEQGPDSPDWEAFRARLGTTIDRHRYERVRYCREELKKALDAKRPWELPFVALRSSLTKYSQPPGRAVTSPPADAVARTLKRWCDQIDDERKYEFKILNLPADWRVEEKRKRLDRGPDHNVRFSKLIAASSFSSSTPVILFRDLVLRTPDGDEKVWCVVGENLTTLCKLRPSAFERTKPPDVLLACIVDADNPDPRRGSLELPACPDFYHSTDANGTPDRPTGTRLLP